MEIDRLVDWYQVSVWTKYSIISDEGSSQVDLSGPSGHKDTFTAEEPPGEEPDWSKLCWPPHFDHLLVESGRCVTCPIVKRVGISASKAIPLQRDHPTNLNKMHILPGAVMSELLTSVIVASAVCLINPVCICGAIWRALSGRPTFWSHKLKIINSTRIKLLQSQWNFEAGRHRNTFIISLNRKEI